MTGKEPVTLPKVSKEVSHPYWDGNYLSVA